MRLFADRDDAGEKLSKTLLTYTDLPNAIIIGLPRGGVVTGAVVAKKLHLPLDIIIPRKLGHPQNPEYAIGAITEEGTPIYTRGEPPEETVAPLIKKEVEEIERRKKVYRGNKPPLSLKNKIAIIVDDGIATGHTMLAALLSAKEKGAEQTIVAVPVIPPENIEKISNHCDELIYLTAPPDFYSISQFYSSFPQNTDEEVISLLK